MSDSSMYQNIKCYPRKDIVSSLLVLVFIVVYAIIAWLFLSSRVAPIEKPAPTALRPNCLSLKHHHHYHRRRHHRPRRRHMLRMPMQPAKVADASGSNAVLNIYVGRGGGDSIRGSIPLPVQKRTLCPGAILAANEGDFVRSDGLTLPGYQVAAWGQVDKAGTHVVVHVLVSPRYKEVTGFGDYSGIVTLSDKRAIGGSVPVVIHVLYPNTSLVLAFAFLAAFAGFTWAWLVHDLRTTVPHAEEAANRRFWRNLILRLAVVLAAAVPIVNAQVLATPSWRGDLTQYIALATLVGAAAIALTPTLRALALPPGNDETPSCKPDCHKTGSGNCQSAAGCQSGSGDQAQTVE